MPEPCGDGASRRKRAPGRCARNRGLGGFQLGMIEVMPLRQAAPQCEQGEVDVTSGAVLQSDQRLGDPGAGIEGERKAPERLAVNLWFPMLLLPHCSSPDELAAKRAICRFYGTAVHPAQR